MPAFTIRIATPDDIRRDLRRLAAPDRVMFAPAVWDRLPELIVDLAAAGRIRLFAVVELPDTARPGSGERIRLLGGTSFVEPHQFEEILANPGEPSVVNGLLTRVVEGRLPFLAPKQVAKANSEGTLVTMDLFGTPDVDLVHQGTASAEDGQVFRAINATYTTCHLGYHQRAVWSEFAVPAASGPMQTYGFKIFRQREAAANGLRGVVTLFRITSEEAHANVGFYAAQSFFSSHPKLGLSIAEQELIEHSLLGQTDPAVAAILGLSEDGLKKRWRSIFRRVAAAEPTLLPPDAPVQSKRKLLLDALRLRPEEIRPYKPVTPPNSARKPLARATPEG